MNKDYILKTNETQETDGVQPASPDSITGMLLTNGQETMLILDYAAFTFPLSEENKRMVSQQIARIENESEIRLLGYETGCKVYGTGMILWSDDRPEMGLHVRLPATALKEMDISAYMLICIVVNNGGWFTRLDIAFDDHSGLIELELVAAHWHSGEINTRYRSMKEYRSAVVQGAGQAELEGLSFGNRESQSYLRIYDKALEQRKKGLTKQFDPWVRIELELKKDKANEVAKKLERMPGADERTEFLTGLLVGLFDIVIDPGYQKNKSRWQRVVWWQDFIGTIEKVRLSLPKIEKTLQQVRNWWASHIAPITAVLVIANHGELSGYQWLIEAIEAGQEKFKRRHIDLIGSSA